MAIIQNTIPPGKKKQTPQRGRQVQELETQEALCERLGSQRGTSRNGHIAAALRPCHQMLRGDKYLLGKVYKTIQKLWNITLLKGKNTIHGHGQRLC